MSRRRGRTLALAGVVMVAVGASGAAHAETRGAPLRDGLSVAALTRLVAPIGVTGSEADTAWYAVLVVDRGVDPRQPLATLAAQAEQVGYARSHQSATTVELVGLANGLLRTVRLGAVVAQGDAPAYLQVVVTSSPRSGP